MRTSVMLAALALLGCSTLESRREKAPVAVLTTTQSLATFQGCFAEKTGRQAVTFLPRANGGSFSASAGPQNFVFWVVDVDDLGAQRRVTVYSAVRTGALLQLVQTCL